MGYHLRQSTATTIPLGPLIDDTDFKTRETAVTYNQSGVDCAIMKNNATWDAVTITDTVGANDWTAKGDGMYIVELTAAQTDTVGPLVVSYFATGILPWTDTFFVIPAVQYDSLIAGSDNLQVDLIQIGGVAQTSSLNDIHTDVGTAISQTASATIATSVWNALLSGITTTSSIGKLIKDYLDAAISSRMSTFTYTAPDNATITDIHTDVGTAITQTTASNIASAVWNALLTGIVTVGSAGKLIKDNLNAVVSTIKTQTDKLTFDGSNRLSVQDPPTTLPSAASISDAVWDEAISGHVGAGTTGVALNSASAPTAAQVADAVWDETSADHNTAGSIGNKLNSTAAASGGTTTIETGTDQRIEVG